MNELVQLIVKKTGLPQAMAMTVAFIVLDYLKQKLPAPFAAQAMALLGNGRDALAVDMPLSGKTVGIRNSTGREKKQ